MQKRSLAEDKLTVTRSLEVAVSMELANKNANELKGNTPTLLGRKWLKYIPLDWLMIMALFQIPDKDLQELLDHHREVFADEIATIQKFQAKPSVADLVKTKF